MEIHWQLRFFFQAHDKAYVRLWICSYNSTLTLSSHWHTHISAPTHPHTHTHTHTQTHTHTYIHTHTHTHTHLGALSQSLYLQISRSGERSQISWAYYPNMVMTNVASYPGCMGGERRPGIDCLRMRDHSQKNLGICLRLEIVGKINTYTSDIFPYHWKIQPFASWITFNSINVKDNHTKPRMLSCSYQLVLVSQYATRCCHSRAWP